ncbi:MAG: DUF1836 domain-containing protein, partial [Lachnospiraceae bacterium]|nr:DUF1836 domain-containing protein [Lachnospiraceae bacterium]
IDIQNLLDSILDSLSRIEYIRPDTMPDIRLYMDQITSFMEDQLTPSKRHKEDKVLTKTMVNNYVKNDLLPPPEKKKYSKEHLLTLIFIYYFKNTLSIQDIRSILNPVTDRYWTNKKGSPSLEEIYSMVFSLEKPEVEQLKETIRAEFMTSQEAVRTMDNPDEEEADFLQKFVFICLLNFDVYVKKLLMEKIIDSMQPHDPKEKRKKGD